MHRELSNTKPQFNVGNQRQVSQAKGTWSSMVGLYVGACSVSIEGGGADRKKRELGSPLH